MPYLGSTERGKEVSMLLPAELPLRWPRLAWEPLADVPGTAGNSLPEAAAVWWWLPVFLGACLLLSHGGWLCKGRAAAVLELEGVLGEEVSCSAACLKLGSA